jgi:hypothetical protein
VTSFEDPYRQQGYVRVNGLIDPSQVEPVRRDTFRDRANLPAPEYLKVDIAGSELPFLAGVQATLASGRLRAIMFELCERDVSDQVVMDTVSSHAFDFRSRHQVETGLYNVWFVRS